jgi:hypothetical protein
MNSSNTTLHLIWWASLKVSEKLLLSKKHNISFISDSVICAMWEAEGKPDLR